MGDVFLTTNIEGKQIIITGISSELAMRAFQRYADNNIIYGTYNTNKINVKNSSIKLSKLDLSKEQDIFELNSKSTSLLLAENMRLIDSKLYKNNDDEYEYWAVYKIDFYDIKDLNKTQTVISSENFNKDLRKIDSNINLDANLDTEPNNYIQFNDTS